VAINKDAMLKTKYDVDLTNEKMELQKQNIDESKKHNEAEIEKKKTEITSSEQQIEQLNKDINLIQKHIDMMQSRVSDELAMKNKSSKLINLESKLESRIKKIEKEVAFYEEHDSCPTCKQGIEQSFRTEQITNLGQTKGQVRTALSDLSTQIEKTNERIVEIQKILKNITSHNNEIVKHNSTITAVNNYIGKIQKEIEELSNKKDNLEEENQKLKELREQLKTLEVKKEELTQEKQYYDLAASLLKDTGIKTKIIRQYLPIMNKLVNKYLTSMDFFVNFNINENFEETIKSRHRDEFSYANFSEGEKMRIDLALLFTWRQIAKLKNSTNTNLLILDEVFDSSLDVTGTEEFLKLIHEMGSDTNIFVISHKGDQLFDKFRSIIRFEKKNNFSQIAK
jgi:DNA repair exonuclease SbcCD ATPase subunit